MKYPPLILIAPSAHKQGAEFCDRSVSLSQCYALAIQAAKGLPCVLPLSLKTGEVAASVRRCDGVMLTGGNDVQTDLYAIDLPSRLKHKVGPPDRQRDWLELELIRAVFRERKPMLAICRGQQILNVAFGGSLVADIASEIPHALNHRCSERKDNQVHKVSLLPDSLLAKVTGCNQLGVNSSHHQAVKRVADPFRVCATSADGVIEALELKPADAMLLPYLLAVQFHPERLIDRHPEFLEIFRGFVRVCARGRKKPL